MKTSLKLTWSFVFSLACFSAIAGNKKGIAASQRLADIKMLSTFLIAANGNMADGNRVVFDQQYSNAVDGNDAIKITNPGENFGLLRNGKVLAVEARQPIGNGDTLFYNMTNLLPQVYKLEIDPQNLATPGITCELVDRYLNTRKNISLTDSNHLTLEITTDPLSKASNRLIVVFSNTVNAIPFSFTGISATINQNRSVNINWQIVQELTVAHYEIERSADNIHFNSLSSKATMYNDQDGGVYQFEDMMPLANDNFYRIRSVSKSGTSLYSNNVKVTIPALATGIQIYPNPAVNHMVQVKLIDMKPGKYLIKITNNSGQQVYSTSVTVDNSNFTQTIMLDKKVISGDYNLSVLSEAGIISTQRLMVQ